LEEGVVFRPGHLVEREYAALKRWFWML
jgi:hypothetical protein